jgi:ABC-type uncharacterized transport system substrate-binding protein
MHWRLAVITVALLLQSCAQPKQKELPATNIASPKPAAELVILVSENIPAYNKVAKALAKKIGERVNIRYLGGGPLENIKMLAAYQDDEHKQFVSIGLDASVAAKILVDKQVVFCQVFNYQDYGLLTAKHKGVSMMPSMSRTFSDWRAFAPDITDIGIITGPGFEDMIQVAKAAARSYGITLHHAAVNSDKEYQYVYKEMANKVQGYWVLPDNRVLSGNVLRDVITFSVHNSKQVAVFSEELLDLGGLFSATSDPQDIAQQVFSRLEQARDKEEIPGPDITYLDKAILRINPVMAQRLNLSIPEQYKKYEKAP